MAVHQDGVNYIANNLGVAYTVIDNLKTGGESYEMKITFKNNGEMALPKALPWALHFCNILMLQPDQLLRDEGTSVVKDGVKLGNSGFHLYPETGCLFRMEATADFTELGPGKQLVVHMTGTHGLVSRTDVMPNWYVTGGSGTVPRTVTSTAGEGLWFVSDFTTKEQWKRAPTDRYNPYTAQDRFTLYKANDLGKAPLRILPTVVKQDLNEEKSINMNTGDWVITYQSQEEKRLAEFLSGMGEEI